MKAKNLGIFASIFASICCLSPLILVLIGLGGLGIGIAIGKYHWWFLGGGVLLIIIAWRYYFKEKKTCELKSCQMENKRLTQIILTFATLIVALFVGLNLYTYAGKAVNLKQRIKETHLESIIIPVEGMTCISCELTVSSALRKIDGVIRATASAKEGKAEAVFDPNKTDLAQLMEAINSTGFKAYLRK